MQPGVVVSIVSVPSRRGDESGDVVERIEQGDEPREMCRGDDGVSAGEAGEEGRWAGFACLNRERAVEEVNTRGRRGVEGAGEQQLQCRYVDPECVGGRVGIGVGLATSAAVIERMATVA